MPGHSPALARFRRRANTGTGQCVPGDRGQPRNLGGGRLDSRGAQMKKHLRHFDDAGAARMVDVATKPPTKRPARADALVKMPRPVIAQLPSNPKGNPLEIARVAGISAAKRTSDLIPLCHPLMLSHVDVEVTLEDDGVRILSSVATMAATGVEMEALTAASVAALTVYDMTKALDKGIEIQDLYLMEKTGGKSGVYRRPSPASDSARR